VRCGALYEVTGCTVQARVQLLEHVSVVVLRVDGRAHFDALHQLARSLDVGHDASALAMVVMRPNRLLTLLDSSLIWTNAWEIAVQTM
jgi:hypothetical protein